MRSCRVTTDLHPALRMFSGSSLLRPWNMSMAPCQASCVTPHTRHKAGRRRHSHACGKWRCRSVSVGISPMKGMRAALGMYK